MYVFPKKTLNVTDINVSIEYFLGFDLIDDRR